MSEAIAVAVGGACGALGRFAVTRAMMQLGWVGFPLATLLVNVVGSFALGLLLGAGDQWRFGSPMVRLGLGTGVLGALTTWSTFSVETVQLAEDRGASWALANVGAQLVLGLGAAALGLYCGRRLTGA